MPDDVRYQFLRPEQIVKRRQECPVVYIPIGTLEWHGIHNAVGADTLQAEGIAIRCAQMGGGLVFPPLYYGEPRLDSLMEAVADDRQQIAEAMALDPANFLADRQPFTVAEQASHYQDLLLHVLSEADTLGFKIGVLVAGHYPLIDHARAAVLQYHQRRMNGHHQMLAWAFVDYLLVQDQYPDAGDHAAGWETSHMLALHPQTVNLDALPDRDQSLVGVMGMMPPQDATAAYGDEIIEQAARVAVQEVNDRLVNPRRYQGHGTALSESLWRSR